MGDLCFRSVHSATGMGKKGENHVIILVEAEKVSNSHSRIFFKNISKLEIEENPFI